MEPILRIEHVWSSPTGYPWRDEYDTFEYHEKTLQRACNDAMYEPRSNPSFECGSIRIKVMSGATPETLWARYQEEYREWRLLGVRP